MCHIYKVVLTLCIMMAFLIHPGERLAAQVATAQPTVKAPLKVVVQGRIRNMRIMGGYYIVSKPEVYRIANQNPSVLQGLAQSGRTVSIEATAQGDLLTIQKIDGQSYSGGKPPAVP